MDKASIVDYRSLGSLSRRKEGKGEWTKNRGERCQKDSQFRRTITVVLTTQQKLLIAKQPRFPHNSAQRKRTTSTMPINIAARNKEHFDLLGIQQCPSPEIETTSRKGLLQKQQQSQPQKQQRKRRNIKFNEVVHVHFTLHVDDLNDEEYFRTWYQKRDFQMMRSEFAKTVMKITNGAHTVDTDEHCARGLEYRTKAGAQKRKLNKLHGLCAVLKEQDRQIDLGINDDEALRAAYLKESRICKREAHELGLDDENETITMRIEEEAARMRENGSSNHSAQEGKDDRTSSKKKNGFLSRIRTTRRAVLEDIRAIRPSKR